MKKQLQIDQKGFVSWQEIKVKCESDGHFFLFSKWRQSAKRMLHSRVPPHPISLRLVRPLTYTPPPLSYTLNLYPTPTVLHPPPLSYTPPPLSYILPSSFHELSSKAFLYILIFHLSTSQTPAHFCLLAPSNTPGLHPAHIPNTRYFNQLQIVNCFIA